MNNFEVALKKIDERDLTGMQWKAQEAGGKDLLFYRLSSDAPAAVSAMAERLSKSAYGLVAINSEKDLGVERALYLSDQEFLELRKLVADRLYPLPEKKIIAITGTNGKTTTVDIIRQVLLFEKKRPLTVGTLGLWVGDEKLGDFALTSPDYIDLRKALWKYQDRYDVCALEASSHAIDQGRLFGFVFDAAGWTSFSQDHLDYHKTMKNYFEAKRSLLKQTGGPFIVSSRSTELKDKLGNDAQVAEALPPLKNPFFKSEFNKVNLEVAVGCLKRLGMEPSLDQLESIQAPPGRFNVIESKERLFVIDFAHTPDALENICKELKTSFPEKKLVCVFGCGGDRDKAKRPLMGAAAAKHSDHVIVTSDNPRFEKPDKIISDVLPGLQGSSYQTITDREEAIKAAVEEFTDAVILIAGKGHEPYIDERGIKRPYSDEAVLRRIIEC